MSILSDRQKEEMYVRARWPSLMSHLCRELVV